MRLGTKQTKEAITKMREALTGRKLSEETKAKMSASKKGHIGYWQGKTRPEETKLKMSISHLELNKTGDKSHNWKTGKIMTTGGYVRVYIPMHPYADAKGYVLEHRLIMEEEIGRYLDSEEVVHHIDFDRTNNTISNLLLFKNSSEHFKHHKQLKKDEIIKAIRGEE